MDLSPKQNEKVMRCPTLQKLPLPPPDKTGWPWTEESPQLPDTMPGGDPWPKISIVTPSLNQGRFIEETIRSVLLQGYPNLEYIIIDGGSIDGTIEIIKKYEKWLKYWVSESDDGQSHAINKGLMRSTGKLFAWINSDDTYCANTLSSIALKYLQYAPCIIAGNVLDFDIKGNIINLVVQKNISLNGVVEFWNVNECQWHQPGLFFPLSGNDDAEFLDNSLRYEMDRDFLIRMLSRYPIFYTDTIIARFRIHDYSKSGKELYRFYAERSRISRRYWHFLPAKKKCERQRNLSLFLIKKASHQFRHGHISDGRVLLEEAWTTSKSKTLLSVLTELKRLALGGKWTGHV